MNIFAYNRIMIVGNNGSGKSYFSKKLALITGLPLVHLDLLYWRPNWEEPPKDEWIAKNKLLLTKDKWIIDGNYNATMELRFKEAELVIFLNINRLKCLLGVLKRAGKARSDMPNYVQKEKSKKIFLKFLIGVWDFPKKRKHTILNLHEKYSKTSFIILNSRRDVNNLLNFYENKSK